MTRKITLDSLPVRCYLSLNKRIVRQLHMDGKDEKGCSFAHLLMISTFIYVATALYSPTMKGEHNGRFIQIRKSLVPG